jgi:uncharacterized protein (DUF433 family)
MDYNLFIESNSAILLGKPIIKGTRLTVELILHKLSEGVNADDLIAAYPALSRDAIHAVLAYASDIVANETIIAVA